MNAAQLAAARAATEQNFTDTCEVHSTTVSDTGYGVSGTVDNTPVTYPCKVQQKLYTKPMEQVSAAEFTQVSDYLVKLPWYASVSPKNTIKTSNGVMLEVLDVPDISTERFALNVDCKRIYVTS